ncbi:unnamed protein product [Closterium sp. NIES-64]|nr:unnamed protein product [Closterium sp. NIES-64]
MTTTVSRRQRAVAPPRASSSGGAERSDASGGAGDTHAHRADAPSNAQRAGLWLTAAARPAAVVAGAFCGRALRSRRLQVVKFPFPQSLIPQSSHSLNPPLPHLNLPTAPISPLTFEAPQKERALADPTNFTNAILSGSQFEGADVTGADFTDAIVDNAQRLLMCRKAKGVNSSGQG